MNHDNAYIEYVDFITSQPTMEQIIEFRPSRSTQDRIRYLMNAKLNHALTMDEETELDEYYRASKFLHQLKLRAQRRLETLQ
ncbi:MAG: hypothetical protein RLP44_31295 [Aggregatilineales bacterium]